MFYFLPLSFSLNRSHRFSSFPCFLLAFLPSFCLLQFILQSVIITHKFEPEGEGGERIMESARQFQNNVLLYVCSQQSDKKQVMPEGLVVKMQYQT